MVWATCASPEKRPAKAQRFKLEPDTSTLMKYLPQMQIKPLRRLSVCPIVGHSLVFCPRITTKQRPTACASAGLAGAAPAQFDPHTHSYDNAKISPTASTCLRKRPQSGSMTSTQLHPSDIEHLHTPPRIAQQNPTYVERFNVASRTCYESHQLPTP